MTRDIFPIGVRVYAAVKRQLLSGEVLPGERLDAARLADRHAASITPVRDALHRLVGEGLVVAEAGEGFHTPRVSEASLRDLYAWNGRCLQQAWHMTPQGVDQAIDPVEFDLVVDVDLVASTERLFATLGRLSGNEQCAEAIATLNDRLHVARTLETHLFPNAAAEWTTLSETVRTGQSGPFQAAMMAYHRRRLRAAPELVRLMHRPLAND